MLAYSLADGVARKMYGLLNLVDLLNIRQACCGWLFAIAIRLGIIPELVVSFLLHKVGIYSSLPIGEPEISIPLQYVLRLLSRNLYSWTPAIQQHLF